MKKLLIAIMCFILIGIIIVLIIPKERYTTENTDRIGISIHVGEQGHYTMWGDAELQYYDGNLYGIDIENITLLAYRHSENWEGGYYIYSYEDIQKIISILKQYPELEDVVNDLEHGLLMDEAST